MKEGEFSAKLSLKGRERRNALIEEVGLDPNQVCGLTLTFDTDDVVSLVAEVRVFPGDLAADLLEVAVRESSMGEPIND